MADHNTDDVASLIELAGDITIAWLQNPNVNPGAEDVPAFLRNIHTAITGLTGDGAPAVEAVTYDPAVPVRSSVKPDHLVSLIDGRKYKTLKRHLAIHGLTPADYRERYGLKADYPMVAPDYAAQRREIAKTLGLGRKRTTDAAPEAAAAEPAKAKRAPAKTKAAAVAAPEAVASAAPRGKAAATGAKKAPAKRARKAAAPEA
ncbi:MucR family transcriptional regulator [Novosphingobium sp.]|jgi:predicted transcriptional regulator|uniref:MucR family transcriptional regulator n=1 Tax=Novosphingobium sp. TaxID=1874826 RepID=UPI0031E1B967